MTDETNDEYTISTKTKRRKAMSASALREKVMAEAHAPPHMAVAARRYEEWISKRAPEHPVGYGRDQIWHHASRRNMMLMLAEWYPDEREFVVDYDTHWSDILGADEVAIEDLRNMGLLNYEYMLHDPTKIKGIGESAGGGAQKSGPIREYKVTLTSLGISEMLQELVNVKN